MLYAYPARAARTARAKIVRHVHQKHSVELVRGFLQPADVRAIRVHRKESFRNHEDCVPRVFRAYGVEFLANVRHVVVAKEVMIRGRGASALHETCVSELIYDYVIVRADKTYNRAEACGPA